MFDALLTFFVLHKSFFPLVDGQALFLDTIRVRDTLLLSFLVAEAVLMVPVAANPTAKDKALGPLTDCT